MQFSVLANSLKPEVRTVTVTSGMEDIIFQLGPGSVIRGVVRNEAGEAISGVRLALESSTGGVSQEYEFEMTSDDYGRFEWNGAPDEPKSFAILKQGYEAKRRQTLKPNEENVVTLRKGRKVQARVLDAGTDKPITQFRAGVGRSYSVGDGDHFNADYPGLKDYTDPNGTFTVDVNEEEINAIKAEADDYSAKVERLPEAVDGVVQVVLRLKPSPALQGIVVDAQGLPVAGATVAITRNGSGGMYVQLRHGRLSPFGSDVKIATTDAVGRFTLNSPPENGGTVVAAGEAGFARASVEEVRGSGQLVLLEYGRIEGSIKVAGQPKAGQEFTFSILNLGIGFDWNIYRATSDDQGHFAIEEIPPGEGQVVRLIKSSPNSWTHSHQTQVVVKPGQTTQIRFGEEGATIQGRALLLAPPADGEALTYSGHLNTRMPEIDRSFANPEAARAFYSSPAWKELIKQKKRYAVSVGADGSLTVDSVPPGEYTLSISAQRPGDGPWNQKTVASGSTTVIVPESASPYPPIWVGDLLLNPVQQ